MRLRWQMLQNHKKKNGRATFSCRFFAAQFMLLTVCECVRFCWLIFRAYRTEIKTMNQAISKFTTAIAANWDNNLNAANRKFDDGKNAHKNLIGVLAEANICCTPSLGHSGRGVWKRLFSPPPKRKTTTVFNYDIKDGKMTAFICSCSNW